MANERAVGTANPNEKGAMPDEIIVALAARQHGLVTRSQLLDAGVSSNRVSYRVKRKRLELVQRGVYRIGPLRSEKTWEMAAVLACGPDSVVSHRSAAVLWQLLPRDQTSPRPAAPVDVTVPIRDRRRRPGIRAHRATLRREELTQVDQIPVTVPARTLLDLASVVGQRALEQHWPERNARALRTVPTCHR